MFHARLGSIAFLRNIAAVTLMGVYLCGCGGEGPGVALVSVKGIVTIDGKPLTRGNVSFRPDKSGGNSATLEPFGEIGADGTYSLITAKKPGAPAGKYIVLVDSTEAIDPNRKDTYTPKSLIPELYAQIEKTPLKVEVTASAASGAYDLKLKK